MCGGVYPLVFNNLILLESGVCTGAGAREVYGEGGGSGMCVCVCVSATVSE